MKESNSSNLPPSEGEGGELPRQDDGEQSPASSGGEGELPAGSGQSSSISQPELVSSEGESATELATERIRQGTLTIKVSKHAIININLNSGSGNALHPSSQPPSPTLSGRPPQPPGQSPTNTSPEPTATDQPISPAQQSLAADAQPPQSPGQPPISAKVEGSVNNPDEYRAAAARLFNELARLNDERLTDRHGRNWVGRARRWLFGQTERFQHNNPEEADAFEYAGRLLRQNQRIRPWMKIATKVLGGAGLVAATVLGGAGFAFGTGLAMKIVAPIAYSIGIKTGLSGLIEGVQVLKFGRRRTQAEMASQREMSRKMEDLRVLLRRKQFTHSEFKTLASKLFPLHINLERVEAAGTTAEQKERRFRKWASLAGGVAFGFLHGIPLGAHDFDGQAAISTIKDASGQMLNQGQIPFQHGTVLKPFTNLWHGHNIFQQDYLYNKMIAELPAAKRYAALAHEPLRQIHSFWWQSAHTVGNAPGMIEASKQGIKSALAALFGMTLAEHVAEPRDNRTIEQQVNAEAAKPENPDKFLEIGRVSQQPALQPPKQPLANTLPEPTASDQPDQQPSAAAQSPAAPAPESAGNENSRQQQSPNPSQDQTRNRGIWYAIRQWLINVFGGQRN